jgi:hypothetical protein
MSWRRGQTYSQDLRDRVLTAEGSARAVACRFGVSVSYVVKARQRLTRTENPRGALENHRRVTRPLQLNRMQKLHPPLRIRTPCVKPL